MNTVVEKRVAAAEAAAAEESAASAARHAAEVAVAAQKAADDLAKAEYANKQDADRAKTAAAAAAVAAAAEARAFQKQEAYERKQVARAAAMAAAAEAMEREEAAEASSEESSTSESSEEESRIKVFVLPPKELTLLERARQAQTIQQKNIIRKECRSKIPPSVPPKSRKRLEEDRKQALELTFSNERSADEWRKLKEKEKRAQTRRGKEVYQGPFHFTNQHAAR